MSLKKKNNLHRKLDDKKTVELDKILSIQSERRVSNDYTVQSIKNQYFAANQNSADRGLQKDQIIIEEHLSGEIKISTRNHYLNYFRLPARPKKEINVKLAALTTRQPTNWKPPANHPWRGQFLFNKNSRSRRLPSKVISARYDIFTLPAAMTFNSGLLQALTATP